MLFTWSKGGVENINVDRDVYERAPNSLLDFVDNTLDPYLVDIAGRDEFETTPLVVAQIAFAPGDRSSDPSVNG